MACHALADWVLVADDKSTLYRIDEVGSMQGDDESTLCSVNQDHEQELTLPIRRERSNIIRVKGVDPDSKDSYGPALTQAIRKRNEALAIELLERGADPDVKDSYGPALTQAIRGGLNNLAKKLLREQITISSTMHELPGSFARS